MMSTWLYQGVEDPHPPPGYSIHLTGGALSPLTTMPPARKVACAVASRPKLLTKEARSATRMPPRSPDIPIPLRELQLRSGGLMELIPLSRVRACSGVQPTRSATKNGIREGAPSEGFSRPVLRGITSTKVSNWTCRAGSTLRTTSVTDCDHRGSICPVMFVCGMSLACPIGSSGR
jgi:hypothetical protein